MLRASASRRLGDRILRPIRGASVRGVRSVHNPVYARDAGKSGHGLPRPWPEPRANWFGPDRPAEDDPENDWLLEIYERRFVGALYKIPAEQINASSMPICAMTAQDCALAPISRNAAGLQFAAETIRRHVCGEVGAVKRLERPAPEQISRLSLRGSFRG